MWLPVWADFVMTIGMGFPISVGPGIVAESWRVLQVTFGDPGHVSVELGVVLQGALGRDR